MKEKSLFYVCAATFKQTYVGQTDPKHKGCIYLYIYLHIFFYIYIMYLLWLSIFFFQTKKKELKH